ncbi:hypothetical protein BKA93DRAFT_754399 [Sparassis latifolia]
MPSSQAPNASSKYRFMCRGCHKQFKVKNGHSKHVHTYHPGNPVAKISIDLQLHKPSDRANQSRRDKDSSKGDGGGREDGSDGSVGANGPARDVRERVSSDADRNAVGDAPNDYHFEHIHDFGVNNINMDDIDSDNMDILGRDRHEVQGQPCDEHGNFLPKDPPPPPPQVPAPGDWYPYRNQTEFETAELLYTHDEMSARNINSLLQLWAATLVKHNDHPPFEDTKDLYQRIDNTLLGEVRWQTFNMSYKGPKPDSDVPAWMEGGYDVWFRDPRLVAQNMLSNPDFDGEIDYSIMHQFECEAPHECRLQNFMSGDWDLITQDPDTHSSTFVPIILSSDKTTVSVAMGQNEYYPLYMLIGNVHNNSSQCPRTYRVSGDSKKFSMVADRRYADDVQFRKFRHQMFHSSLSKILQPLKPSMTTPEVTCCADGHFRRVIYGLGPYIADYPEQALLAWWLRYGDRGARPLPFPPAEWCARLVLHMSGADEPSHAPLMLFYLTRVRTSSSSRWWSKIVRNSASKHRDGTAQCDKLYQVPQASISRSQMGQGPPCQALLAKEHRKEDPFVELQFNLGSKLVRLVLDQFCHASSVHFKSLHHHEGMLRRPSSAKRHHMEQLEHWSYFPVFQIYDNRQNRPLKQRNCDMEQRDSYFTIPLDSTAGAIPLVRRKIMKELIGHQIHIELDPLWMGHIKWLPSGSHATRSVFMVQAQSEAASVGIILPLPRDIPVLAQVETHLATVRTIKGGHHMIPQIVDHLPAVITHGLTARILYDDPAVREDFGLGHPPDSLPDIGTLHLRVETLCNAARELYDVMRGITSRRKLADGTLRRLWIVVKELELPIGVGLGKDRSSGITRELLMQSCVADLPMVLSSVGSSASQVLHKSVDVSCGATCETLSSLQQRREGICITPISLSSKLSGPLLYLSRSSSPTMHPVWMNCNVHLQSAHVLITWHTMQGNLSTYIVSFTCCTDVCLLSLDNLTLEEGAILPGSPDVAVKVFELLFKRTPRENFASHSVVEHATLSPSVCTLSQLSLVKRHLAQLEQMQADTSSGANRTLASTGSHLLATPVHTRGPSTYCICCTSKLVQRLSSAASALGVEESIVASYNTSSPVLLLSMYSGPLTSVPSEVDTLRAHIELESPMAANVHEARPPFLFGALRQQPSYEAATGSTEAESVHLDRGREHGSEPHYDRDLPHRVAANGETKKLLEGVNQSVKSLEGQSEVSAMNLGDVHTKVSTILEELHQHATAQEGCGALTVSVNFSNAMNKLDQMCTEL